MVGEISIEECLDRNITPEQLLELVIARKIIWRKIGPYADSTLREKVVAELYKRERNVKKMSEILAVTQFSIYRSLRRIKEQAANPEPQEPETIHEVETEEIVLFDHDQAEKEVEETRKNREAGEKSIWEFGKIYLGHYLEYEQSKLHQDLYAMFEGFEPVNKDRVGERIAIAAPRGSAKSTIVNLLFVLWSICYEKESLIVLISSTATEANTFLGHIKDELEDNEKLLNDFPEICGAPQGREKFTRKWMASEIVTKNGIKVVARGTLNKIRGIRHKQHRPGLIICDDLEDDESVKTNEQRGKVRNWFDKALLFTTRKQCHIFVIGTIIHYDSLLCNLLDNKKSPAWTGSRYQSVIKWAINTELWEQWSAIYGHQSEYMGKSGPLAAKRYYEANQVDLNAGTDVLWPANEPYYDLMVEREANVAAFNSEKQNEPIDPKDCYFQEEDIHYWQDEGFDTEAKLLASIESYQVIGSCDPSLGKSGKKGDYTAIITLIQDDKTKILYVVDSIIRRMKPDSAINSIINIYKNRKHNAFHFETVAFQDFMKTELLKRSHEQGYYIPVVDVKTSTDKLARIQSLEPLVKRGTIVFSKRHTLLLEQLKQFPKAAHDDGPDALEMAVRGAETVVEPSAEIIYIDPEAEAAASEAKFLEQFMGTMKRQRKRGQG